MLQIDGLTKTFRFRDTPIQALDGIDIDVAEGEFFVLLGPSGCGKTTILRSIAGLERADGGRISIDGTCVYAGDQRVFLPPERRPIAMVFQSYAVWPHMDVRENVAFPLREGVRRLPADQVDRRVDEVLELLQLTRMADRPVTMLSGGQQQRVALARALALQPKVLLMDEPLSNLDFQLQIQLRAQLKALVRRLGLTTVYVTHNQAEAMELGDRIAVMNRGRMEQVGTPRAVYQRPRNEFVANFIGDMSLVKASIGSVADGSAVLESEIGRIRVARPAEDGFRPKDACLVGVRPEDVRLLLNGERHEENNVRGRVVARQFVGEAMIYTVAVGATSLRLKVHHSVNLDDGRELALYLPPEHCAVLYPSHKENGAEGFDDFLDQADHSDGFSAPTVPASRTGSTLGDENAG